MMRRLRNPVTLIVQKYGGSSLGSAEHIKAVATRVVDVAAGRRVCVVASAMGDMTDELLGLAAEVTPLPPPRELDMLLTAASASRSRSSRWRSWISAATRFRS